MKYFRRRVHRLRLRVAPHWGAWIEMNWRLWCRRRTAVAPHWGAWIEIVGSTDDPTTSLSHPTGVRGLKLMDELLKHLQNQVAPHWGAWIEISPR